MERIAIRREGAPAGADGPERAAPSRKQRRSPTIRRSALRVGAADDPAELAADRVADEVMRALRDADSSGAQLGLRATKIRRSALAGDPIGPGGGDVPADLAGRVRAASGGGRALDDTTRSSMEQAFGADFSRVRVHEGAEASALNDAMGARAFTLGRDIFVREPIDPRRPPDQHLLAHELAHTVQQGVSDAPALRRSAARRSTAR